MVRERDACILAVHSVASFTVVRECFPAVIPRFLVVRERVLLFFVADEKVVLGKSYGRHLKSSRRIRFAGGRSSYDRDGSQPDDDDCGELQGQPAHL